MPNKIGSSKSLNEPVLSQKEVEEFIKRGKRFRSFIGFTHEVIAKLLKYDRKIYTSFESCNFKRVCFLGMKKKLEKLMEDVKDQLEIKKEEEPSEMKTRARQLLNDKMKLFDEIMALKAQIRLDDERIANLDCDVGVNVIDPSTSETAPQVKEEPDVGVDATDPSTSETAPQVKEEPDVGLDATDPSTSKSVPQVKEEPDVGVDATDPSTSKSIPQVKEEPSSQPPEDARLQVHQRAAFNFANYEWFKKHLKDRSRQRHYVYVVINPVSKKIVYVGQAGDVMFRMECHRNNPNSAIYEFLKEFPRITAQIVFSGSYYSCRAVESMIINMQNELGLDLMNISKETESVTPKKKKFVQIEDNIQTIISDFPVNVNAPNHDRVFNGIKFLLDRSFEYGEVITNVTEEIWGPITGAKLHFETREAEGITEHGLTVDKPFDNIRDELQKSDMAKFVDKFTEFRAYYNLKIIDIGVVSKSQLAVFLNPNQHMKEKNRQKYKAILEQYMEDYQIEHGAMERPDYLETIISCAEKRLEQYQKYLDFVKLKRENQPRIIAELEFQKEVYPLIYGSEIEESKPEVLSQQSQFRADYIWVRQLLKDRDGKIHHVYGVKDPVTEKYVYGGESSDIKERIIQHRSDPKSSIYDFLQEHDKVQVVQLYSGSYYACKTIETILIALEDELECMDLLNKGKNTRKTTPKKKKYVNVGNDVFCLPQEFDMNDDGTRVKLVDAINCLLDDANKENIVITSMRHGSTRKRSSAEDGSDEQTMILKKVKREIVDDGNDEILNDWEIAAES